jgi:hypothetical protein
MLRFVLFVTICLLTACGGGGDGDNDDDEGGGSIPSTSSNYTLLAWNDLGMHCLNPTYDTLVILPPYNTVWAQLVKRGSPPQLVTSGVTIEYSMVGNSSSVLKKYPPLGSDYGQFWAYVQQLFGVVLAPDTGLNLVNPALHNSLSGTMVLSGNHFEVDGIPVTPVDDNNVWNPYQVIEIKAKDASGNVLATTRATVPTSDEIRCNICHGTNAFANILQSHDASHNTNLTASTPVLCADCHGSPALNTVGPGSSGLYLSEAIHGYHANKSTPQGATIGCYDCHPGNTTRCNRSLAHTAANGNCTACHGDMQQVADSITTGRIPWVTEPKCSACHAAVAEVDTGTVLYRNAKGHGGMNCAACHGSPHAMVPSGQASDNYQAIQYQGAALSLGSCAVCHSGSKGEGAREFLEEHGGTRNPSACGVCHTTITTNNTALWPHHFEWKNR